LSTVLVEMAIFMTTFVFWVCGSVFCLQNRCSCGRWPYR